MNSHTERQQKTAERLATLDGQLNALRTWLEQRVAATHDVDGAFSWPDLAELGRMIEDLTDPTDRVLGRGEYGPTPQTRALDRALTTPYVVARCQTCGSADVTPRHRR